MNKRLCVLLLQLGGPSDVDAIEPFLRTLFEDVLTGPKFWRRWLGGMIARRRVPQVTPLYQELGGGSPLLANTQAQAEALEQVLRDRGIDARVLTCMRYAPPRAKDVLEEARRDWNDAQWVALPLYPQYSFATTGSSFEELQALTAEAEWARMVDVPAYPEAEGYVDAIARAIQQCLTDLSNGAEPHLVFSAHGLPLRFVRRGDPYPEQVLQTVEAVLERLPRSLPYTLCFQSRVGRARWLEPSTQQTLMRLGDEGTKQVIVVPVSFVSEHIETLHELDIQLRDVAKAHGVETYLRAQTPSTDRAFIETLADLACKAAGAPATGKAP